MMIIGQSRNDPEIPHIPWREIQVGEVLGHGASGIVSKGVWTNGVYVSMTTMILLSCEI